MKTSFIIVLLLFGYVVLNAQNIKSDEVIVEEYMKSFQEINRGEASENLPIPKEGQYALNKEFCSTLVRQEGIGNYSNIQIEGKLSITQKGGNNFSEFLTYYGRGNLTMNILQEGVGNSIQIYGENSLIDNMMIIQKASHQDIIITNK